MGSKFSGKDLIKIGYSQNNTVNIALGTIHRYRKKEKKERVLQEAKEVLLSPNTFIGDGVWGKVAEGLVKPVEVRMQQLKNQRVPFTIFGENEIDKLAKRQLYDALKLPIAVQGALMPDAHSGYGLPIGGVLAVDNAVIPYGVGVDIGCRMSLSVFDLPASYFKGKDFQLQNILKDNTKFGMNETQKIKGDHEVFSRSEFRELPLLKSLYDKAYKQLGSSGGGNHFVEFEQESVEWMSELPCSVTLKLKGNEVNKFVERWVGTIQWICKSPFRPFHKRKNWFIAVIEIAQKTGISIIDERDVIYQSMRSSGPGGQNVNKVSTGVRASHIPTGLTVQVMDSRSQLQNKQLALIRLQEKIVKIHTDNSLQIQTGIWLDQTNINRGNPQRTFSDLNFQER